MEIISTQTIHPGENSDQHSWGSKHNILSEGKLLFEKWYDRIEYTSCGNFIVHEFNDFANSRYHLHNEEGERLIDTECCVITEHRPGNIYGEDKFGMSIVTGHDAKLAVFLARRAEDKKMNFFRGDGTQIFPTWHDQIEWDNRYDLPEFVRIKDEDKYNFVNTQTMKIISREYFSEISKDYVRLNKERSSNPDVIAIVKVKNRWWPLTRNGQIIKNQH